MLARTSKSSITGGAVGPWILARRCMMSRISAVAWARSAGSGDFQL